MSELVVAGLWRLAHFISNAYLLDSGDGLILIDTGVAGRAGSVLAAIEATSEVGPLRTIALTHAHSDHAGSLARVASARSGVPVVVGAADVPVIRAGGIPPVPTPTSRLGAWLMGPAARVAVEPWPDLRPITDGETVPGTADLRAVAAPGHTPGHHAFLWPAHGGVLLAGDTCVNLLGLRESLVHEDRDAARSSLVRVAELDFEVAVFGHGPPIRGSAAARLRRLAERLVARHERADG
jgi:glyoxylase-like metal-dependent hydrolase (beta-lactamase superfamily II)